MRFLSYPGPAKLLSRSPLQDPDCPALGFPADPDAPPGKRFIDNIACEPEHKQVLVLVPGACVGGGRGGAGQCDGARRAEGWPGRVHPAVSDDWGRCSDEGCADGLGGQPDGRHAVRAGAIPTTNRRASENRDGRNRSAWAGGYTRRQPRPRRIAPTLACRCGHRGPRGAIGDGSSGHQRWRRIWRIRRGHSRNGSAPDRSTEQRARMIVADPSRSHARFPAWR
jgi:hypothetical protein